MSGIFLCLVFVSLAISALAHSTVPLFLWSEEGYFGDERQSHPEFNGLGFKIQDFVRTFIPDSMDNVQDSLSNYISKPQKYPEVLVAFVFSKLDSSDIARQNGAYSSDADSMSSHFIKDMILNSKSSLIVPHVLIEKSPPAFFSLQLKNIFSTYTSQPEILSLQLTFKKDAILGRLQESSQIFSNKKTDLILVQADEIEHMQEDCIKSILNTVSTLTKGNFISMLTADAPKTNVVEVFPPTFFSEHPAISENSEHPAISVDYIKNVIKFFPRFSEHPPISGEQKSEHPPISAEQKSEHPPIWVEQKSKHSADYLKNVMKFFPVFSEHPPISVEQKSEHPAISVEQKPEHSRRLSQEVPRPIKIDGGIPILIQEKALVMGYSTSPGVKYLTSNILFGIFFGLFFLFVMLCGANCLLSIETPQRLTSRRYNIGKES